MMGDILDFYRETFTAYWWLTALLVALLALWPVKYLLWNRLPLWLCIVASVFVLASPWLVLAAAILCGKD